MGSLFFGSSGEEPVEGEGEGDQVEEVAGEISMIEQEVVWEGLDPIVVNPAGTGGLRFVSVHVNLGLTSQAVADAIEERFLTSRILDTLDWHSYDKDDRSARSPVSRGTKGRDAVQAE
jgi:flagellar basal body-associated protein FliL